MKKVTLLAALFIMTIGLAIPSFSTLRQRRFLSRYLRRRPPGCVKPDGPIPVFRIGRKQLVPSAWVLADEARQLGEHAPSASTSVEAVG